MSIVIRSNAVFTGVFGFALSLATIAVAAETPTKPTAESATKADGAASAAGLGLPELLAHIEQTSPELAAARANVIGVRSRRALVTKLPEPVVGIALQPLPVETRVGPQRARLSISQGIPWLGKLHSRAAAVDAMARAAERRYDAVLARVRRDVRLPWAQLAWLRLVAAIVANQRDLLIGLEPSVLARLRTGVATYEDTQRLRLLIGELDDRHKSLLDKQRAVSAMVLSAAGLPATTKLSVATVEADPLDGRPIPALGDLLGALAKNPGLVAAQAKIAAAQATSAAADTKRLPDFMVGIDWIMVGEARMPGVADSGSDAVMLMAAVKLPTWTRAYDAEVAAADAAVRVAKADRERVLRMAEARLAALLFDLRDARRKRALYNDDLVPRARSAMTAALTSYSNGRAKFNDLIELQKKLLMFQIRLATADVARVRATADLELLMGAPLVPRTATSEEPKP